VFDWFYPRWWVQEKEIRLGICVWFPQHGVLLLTWLLPALRQVCLLVLGSEIDRQLLAQACVGIYFAHAIFFGCIDPADPQRTAAIQL
jgi:hypothetical protein